MEWKHRGYANVKDFMAGENGMENEELFLFPCESSIVHLRDAAKLIFSAIKNNKAVKVIGDYDVDGICSAYILYWMFEKMNIKAQIRLPKRFSEGYGLSSSIVNEIIANRIEPGELIIAIDNGITAVSQIKRLKYAGFKTLIIDHHQPGAELPEADVIVNPHVYAGDFNEYCAAGLAYKLAKGVCAIAPEINTDELLVMAAIATVADSVSLRGENRLIVQRGIKALNEGRFGKPLHTLLSMTGCTYITEETIGYTVAPVINASGRLFDDGAQKCFDFFAENQGELEAKCLIDANERRKNLVEETMARVEEDLLGYPENRAILVAGDYHEGIVGLIAGKIAEERNVPAIVLSKKDGAYKGSARSARGMDLMDLIRSLGKYLASYGGHSGAAGLSTKSDDLTGILEAVQGYSLPEAEGEQYYDIYCDEKDVTAVANEMEIYCPYGQDNRRPIVMSYFENVPKFGKTYKVIKERYYKLHGRYFSIMLFDGSVVNKWESLGRPLSFYVIGYPKLHRYIYDGRQYEEIQLEAVDILPIKKRKKETREKFLEYFKEDSTDV